MIVVAAEAAETVTAAPAGKSFIEACSGSWIRKRKIAIFRLLVHVSLLI